MLRRSASFLLGMVNPKLMLHTPTIEESLRSSWAVLIWRPRCLLVSKCAIVAFSLAGTLYKFAG